MADVTGPISTMPGSGHSVPDNMMCDEHPDILAVSRIQGETDSFGCEMIDMCQACLNEHRRQMAIWRAEAAKGICDWCGKEVTDLRQHRDFEEGMCGRLYDVCGECRRKESERLRTELDDEERYA